MSLARARAVADAVLYEGYVLFPYRPSAVKNRYRWQFGVLMPRPHVELDGAEPWRAHTETLVEVGPDTSISVLARFLHLRHRPDGAGWDETTEREVSCGPLPLGALAARDRAVPFRFPDEHAPGSVAEPGGPGEPDGDGWRHEVLEGVVRIGADRLDAAAGLVRIRVGIENLTAWTAPGAARDVALRRSLVGAQTILRCHEGAFVSLVDPPAWAAEAASECRSEHVHPVLAGAEGERDVVLASPIILHDHPQVAPESTGDHYDATEIDELLALMVGNLTDDEKAEVRRGDVRAAEVLDRVEGLSPEMLERLHGAIRGMRRAERRSELRQGARVRLHPQRRADAQDMFAAGRVGRVERLVTDREGVDYVAVTLEDDPGADLHRWYGRFLYFHRDEVAPVEAGEPAAGVADTERSEA